MEESTGTGESGYDIVKLRSNIELMFSSNDKEMWGLARALCHGAGISYWVVVGTNVKTTVGTLQVFYKEPLKYSLYESTVLDNDEYRYLDGVLHHVRLEPPLL